MLTLILSSCGNPDFGQNPRSSLSPEQEIEVTSLEEASQKCREYIRDHGLGGGNWSGGQILKDGKPFAYVSYNGRVWVPSTNIRIRKRKPNFTGGEKLHPDWKDN